MYTGELHIGGTTIPCAVLNNGQRVLTQEGFLQAIGRAGKITGGQGFTGENMPPFFAAKNLQPFISADLLRATTPVVFRPLKAQGSVQTANGYPAEALPEVCKTFLAARDAGALHPSQYHIAEKADILIRGLATVGIIALVDEATGYQEVRRRNALNKILEIFVAKELMPWTKRFPDEFYQHMFRLRNWPYDEEGINKRPGFAGQLTNRLIYEKLPPGVLEELQRVNPTDGHGRRRYRLHQYLTSDIGHPALQRQVIEVTILMKAAESWTGFLAAFTRAYPGEGMQIYLDVDDESLLTIH